MKRNAIKSVFKNLHVTMALLVAIMIMMAACQTGDKKADTDDKEGDKPKEEIKLNEVVNTSYTTKGGEKIMRIETVVPGTAEEMWKMHTNSEELKTFMAPVIKVDFKIGGLWEASYDPKAKIGDKNNIINQVVAYIPNKMFAIRTVTLPGVYIVKGYEKEMNEMIKNTIATIEFEDLGNNKVKIIESVIGWKDSPRNKVLWDESLKANIGLLDCFTKRLKNGPLDWEKVLAQGF
jgi:uncharacterized protein YndB with AHSA1/START domain